MVCVRSIRVFREFPVDPYYEPLVWFMINYILAIIHGNIIEWGKAGEFD